ncbi:MAG: hypothetical protein ACR2PB_00320 [Desulfocapsaceae bacterium]
MTNFKKYLYNLGLDNLLALNQNRGKSYVVGWAHRVTGLLLLAYVLLHINTLSTLSDPEIFARKAEMFSGPLFVFLEWLLAVPVIFHCLNGGRLLVYELFTTRHDEKLLDWAGTLSIIYILLLGYLMFLGNQEVSPLFFWLTALILSLIVTFAVGQKIIKAKGSIFWKLQRMSGAFLFVLVPAHMLFMHLNPAVGRDVAMITERLNQPLIIAVDVVLLLCILYHGGYGLIGIMKDYLNDRQTIKIASAVVIIVLLLFGLQGIGLAGSLQIGVTYEN